jgi:succinyl-CoA synthetase beta subunit
MNIHEYQAKALLREYGVRVPNGLPVFSIDEAERAAKQLDSNAWVVKAQIHAGGRGAGHFANAPNGRGGVSLVRNHASVRTQTERMLGNTLVTKQTGPQGKEVQRILVEEACDIARELYLGMLLDRGTSRLTMMASTEGGMSIEDVAAQSPEKIIRISIDPVTGIKPFHARRIAFGLGLSGPLVAKAMTLVQAMYRAFVELDASVIEMNPLVVTRDGELMALDAKMNFDDNALFRQPRVLALRDVDEEDPLEAQAEDNHLNYIKLDGTIGCMVNGAGLAMATMDIIKLYGAEPANFLDVGGNADRERVTVAFKLIMSDPNVKGVLVNIFGGIMRCDVIAEGVVAAAREVDLNVPLVVRLEGTNVERGKEILAESGLHVLSADDLADAARKIVDSVSGG